MKVYISGPMEGVVDLNFPAFNEAERQLRRLGFNVLNPARHGQGDEGKAYYMRRAIHDVLAADSLALLPDWERSTGARLEVSIAEMLGLSVQTLSGWLE